MRRLTRKETEKFGDYIFVDGEETCPNEVATKLGEYEDLEEEVGCPLDVLVKALKNGVYCLDEKTGGVKWVLRGWYNKGLNTEYEEEDSFGFIDERLLYNEDNIADYYRWSDYNKTWWLKEDRSE